MPLKCAQLRPPLLHPAASLAQMFPMEDRGEDDGDRGRVWASLRSGITGETEEAMSVPCPTGGWVVWGMQPLLLRLPLVRGAASGIHFKKSD